MGYNPPSFSSKAPLSAAALNQITDSIEYQHTRIPYTFALDDGSLISEANGIGEVVGKIDVDPATYSGYVGNPGSWGQFEVDFPSGLFDSLLGLEVQVASGGNGAMTATVRGKSGHAMEDETGFTCFVNDPGGTTITPFAIWVYAKGVLNSGKIP